jgi:hypothetical protein
MKDPPDKYRCLKLPLSSIIYKTDDAIANMDILQNAISRANDITTKTYFLLRLWILEKYHNDLAIPTITEDTISMCMKSINKSVLGQKPKGNNAILLNEFQQLRNSSDDFGLEDGSNLSAVLHLFSLKTPIMGRFHQRKVTVPRAFSMRKGVDYYATTMIHSILTYQMENNRKGCINRDKNGCKNIKKVFNSYIQTGERPERYRREYKLQ